jgi:hypothetical protein
MEVQCYLIAEFHIRKTYQRINWTAGSTPQSCFKYEIAATTLWWWSGKLKYLSFMIFDLPVKAVMHKLFRGTKSRILSFFFGYFKFHLLHCFSEIFGRFCVNWKWQFFLRTKSAQLKNKEKMNDDEDSENRCGEFLFWVL